MSDETGADDLRRENERLRGELAQVARERAAESVGLPADTARWITGDTLEEAKADAAKLARQVNARPGQTHTPPGPPGAEPIRQHAEQQQKQAASIVAADTKGDTTR